MPLRKKVLFLSFSLFFPSSFLLPPLFSLFFPSSPFFSPFSPHPSFSFYFLLLPYCCFSSFSFLYVHSFLLSFHVFSLLPFSSLHQSIHLIYLMSFFTFPSFSAKLVCICITLISYSITNSPIFSVELTLHPSFSLYLSQHSGRSSTSCRSGGSLSTRGECGKNSNGFCKRLGTYWKNHSKTISRNGGKKI